MLFIEIPPDTKQINVNIDNLVPFKNYPLEWFYKGYLFKAMFDNIHEYGICNPIDIRPISNEKYEILDGHYRVAAAKELNLTTIPAVVHEGITDEEALCYVTRSNPIGLILFYDINIHDDNYKDSAGYKKMEAELETEGYSKTELDECITHNLLEDVEIHNSYESIYNMGDSSELDDEECKYESVALEIAQLTLNKTYQESMKKTSQLERSKDPRKVKEAVEIRNNADDEIDNLVEKNVRKLKDYTRQLKNYLNIDLDLFDYSLLQNKRERAKILYFIYMIREKEKIHRTKILRLLSQPSMENVDNSSVGRKTSNGEYIKEIKHQIEQEISPTLKMETKKKCARS